MSERYQGVELPDGVTLRQQDADVAYHGREPFSREGVAPGRRVVVVPGREWPASSPEECEDYSRTGEWISDGSRDVMVCRGCGLDCT